MIRVCLVLVGAIVVLLVLVFAMQSSRYRDNVKRAQLLHPGMSVAEVKAIMGTPLKATVRGDRHGRLTVMLTYATLLVASHDVAVSFYSGRDSLSAVIWDGPGWFGDPPP